MTDDLVKRLRSNRPIPTLPHEAADRIEALTAEVAAYGRSLELKQALIEELKAENKQLRGLAEELADDLEDELQARWGFDERLAYKLERDMDIVERTRAALEKKP